MIPMSEEGGIRYYAFGIDAKYKNMIDLGGHRETWDDSVLHTALRELHEESLGIFDSDELTRQCKIFYTDELFFLLLPVKKDRNAYVKEFHKRLILEREPEVVDIVWLTLDQIEKQIEFMCPLTKHVIRDGIRKCDAT